MNYPKESAPRSASPSDPSVNARGHRVMCPLTRESSQTAKMRKAGEIGRSLWPGYILRVVELARHVFPMVPVLTRAPSRLGEDKGIVDGTMACIRASDAERMASEQVGGMDAGKALIHGNLNQPKPGHSRAFRCRLR